MDGGWYAICCSDREKLFEKLHGGRFGPLLNWYLQQTHFPKQMFKTSILKNSTERSFAKELVIKEGQSEDGDAEAKRKYQDLQDKVQKRKDGQTFCFKQSKEGGAAADGHDVDQEDFDKI